ncbi:MAG TPA: hypothetical protein VIU61_28015 [Kofleriaceae bacterium]
MLRVVLLAILAVGCYSPELAPCVVRCSADVPCPDGMSCGADQRCHGDGETEDCPPDKVMLRVSIEGFGNVSGASELDCMPLCEALVEPDVPVTLIATPNEGSRFVRWSGAAASCLGPECTVTISEAADVGAQFNFAQPIYIDFLGNGHGRVTDDTGVVNCSASCTALVDAGAVVNLRANTEVASTAFHGWGGACADSELTDRCTLGVGSPQTITVAFDTARVFVEPLGSGGKIVTTTPYVVQTCQPECMAEVNPDSSESVEVEAFAGPNSVFKEWIGCGNSGNTANPCSLVVTADTYIFALFEPIFIVNMTVQGSGRVNGTSGFLCVTGQLSCMQEYGFQEVVTMTPTPNAGSFFKDWDGTCPGTVNNTTGGCTFVVDSSVSLTARFAILPDPTLTE